MFTHAGVERIMKFAFNLARSRPRKLLTVVTKSNAQCHAMVMRDEIAPEVASGRLGRHLGQDAGRLHDPMRMGMRPMSLDTSAATNLHADNLSGFAAPHAGSLRPR